MSDTVQRKNAEEEVQLAKKQEESEAVRQAHREEARLREDYIQRRLQAKVCYPSTVCCPSLVTCCVSKQPLLSHELLPSHCHMSHLTPHSSKQQLQGQGLLPFIATCHTSQHQAAAVGSRFATCPLPLLTAHSTKNQAWDHDLLLECCFFSYLTAASSNCKVTICYLSAATCRTSRHQEAVVGS